MEEYTTASGAEVFYLGPDLYQITEPFSGNTCYLTLLMGGGKWRAQTLPIITGSGHGEIIARFDTFAEALECL